MRILICLFALCTAAHAAIGPPVLADPPHQISIVFKSGDTAIFGLTSNTSIPSGANISVESLLLNVANKFYAVPLTDCRSLKDIHFETASFLHLELAKRLEGTFTLTFRMGDEGARKFGELPQINISYAKGHFVDATITRLTSQHSSLTSPLCFAPL
jgi:hypothetical protein